MRFVVEGNPELWKTKDEARVWMNEASRTLEELDTAINRVHLRLKARFKRDFETDSKQKCREPGVNSRLRVRNCGW